MDIIVAGPKGGKVDVGLQAYVHLAVRSFAKQLGISKLKTVIKIRVHQNLTIDNGDAEGLCEALSPRHFIIDVALFGNWISTLAHEMVHVKQFALGELSPNLTKWKSRNNVSNIEYWDQPWEKEARRLQYRLVESFCTEED